jgi:flavodoxin
MKTLIVYSSKSGNTKKLAEAVHAHLPGETVIQAIEENPDSAGYDLVVVGFWLQAGKVDPLAGKYLENLGSGSKLFLMATHGAAVHSQHALNAMTGAKKMASSCHILGSLNCQGEVNADFLVKAQAKEPPPPWIKDAPSAAGHPDDADIAKLLKEIDKITS